MCELKLVQLEGLSLHEMTACVCAIRELEVVLVQAAPLAHGKMLEHEIKDIASNQGVEGHRAVARKFAELLMAKGGCFLSPRSICSRVSC